MFILVIVENKKDVDRRTITRLIEMLENAGEVNHYLTKFVMHYFLGFLFSVVISNHQLHIILHHTLPRNSLLVTDYINHYRVCC
jgi:hypothetical protein